MNGEEVSNVFFGAITIIALQLCLISLVMIFSLTDPSFKIIASESFSIILARLFASMMMHLSMAPEIYSGLVLAKYCLNHPSRFKGARNIDPETGKYSDKINISAILPPFLLGIS